MAEIVDSLANRILELEHENAATRFEEISESDTFDIIDRERNVNTSKATKSHMRLFSSWLQANKELRQPEDILPAELDMLFLEEFRCY